MSHNVHNADRKYCTPAGGHYGSLSKLGSTFERVAAKCEVHVVGSWILETDARVAHNTLNLDDWR